jgi:hypothetical protein
MWRRRLSVTWQPCRVDIVLAAHQKLTREWWGKRGRFELFVSQAVVDEAARGNAAAAGRRLALLTGTPLLALGGETDEFANRLIREHVVPRKAKVDAVHIAVAAVNRVNYLVTWNCTHIANAAIRGKIEQTCRGAGLQAPIICTPEELMEA